MNKSGREQLFLRVPLRWSTDGTARIRDRAQYE